MYPLVDGKPVTREDIEQIPNKRYAKDTGNEMGKNRKYKFPPLYICVLTRAVASSVYLRSEQIL